MDRNRKKTKFPNKVNKRHFVGPTGVLFVKPFYETLVALPCKNILLPKISNNIDKIAFIVLPEPKTRK